MKNQYKLNHLPINNYVIDSYIFLKILKEITYIDLNCKKNVKIS